MPIYCPLSSCEWWHRAEARDALVPGCPVGVCIKTATMLQLSGTGGALECTSYVKGQKRTQWRPNLPDPGPG